MAHEFGILLDLDNTLLDDHFATEQGFLAFLAEHQARNDDLEPSGALARWRRIVWHHWERYERGEISFQEQRRCRVREFLGQDLDDSAADLAYRSYQRGYEAGWRLLPGVTEFFERTVDVPKVIITNGDREAQSRKVQAMGIEPHVVGVVTPGDCGHWKPSPVIFEAALALLDLEAARCLMIGDDEVRDIAPALRLGMRCYHVRPGRTVLEALSGA